MTSRQSGRTDHQYWKLSVKEIALVLSSQQFQADKLKKVEIEHD